MRPERSTIVRTWSS
jgi:hypothetical protein